MLTGNLMRDWRDRLTLRSRKGAGRQSGAIPYTVVDGQVVFLLVTSRGTGRWIFPKGEPIEGLTPWQVAEREASEEAGIEGEVDSRPLGSYRSVKTIAIRRRIVDVEMYPLRVTRQFDEWPEQKHRHRHWAILPEAKRLLSNPQLAALAAKLTQRVRLQPQFANHPAIERISSQSPAARTAAAGTVTTQAAAMPKTC